VKRILIAISIYYNFRPTLIKLGIKYQQLKALRNSRVVLNWLSEIYTLIKEKTEIRQVCSTFVVRFV